MWLKCSRQNEASGVVIKPTTAISIVLHVLRTHLQSLLVLSRRTSSIGSWSAVVGDSHDVAEHHELGSVELSGNRPQLTTRST